MPKLLFSLLLLRFVEQFLSMPMLLRTLLFSCLTKLFHSATYRCLSLPSLFYATQSVFFLLQFSAILFSYAAAQFNHCNSSATLRYAIPLLFDSEHHFSSLFCCSSHSSSTFLVLRSSIQRCSSAIPRCAFLMLRKPPRRSCRAYLNQAFTLQGLRSPTGTNPSGCSSSLRSRCLCHNRAIPRSSGGTFHQGATRCRIRSMRPLQ